MWFCLKEKGKEESVRLNSAAEGLLSIHKASCPRCHPDTGHLFSLTLQVVEWVLHPSRLARRPENIVNKVLGSLKVWFAGEGSFGVVWRVPRVEGVGVQLHLVYSVWVALLAKSLRCQSEPRVAWTQLVQSLWLPKEARSMPAPHPQEPKSSRAEQRPWVPWPWGYQVWGSSMDEDLMPGLVWPLTSFNPKGGRGGGSQSPWDPGM